MGNNYHYYASHALGYAMAESREEAVEKLAKMSGMNMKSWLLNSHKEGEPGVYVWSCKVMLPIDAEYKIEWFQPVGVPKMDGREHYVTYYSAKKVAIYNKPKHESLAEAAEEAA